MIDPERLRVRAGFPVDDTTHDDELQLAFDQALTLCETYCDRWFVLMPQVEQIFPTRGAFMVRRYPIEVIDSISDANGGLIDPASYAINGSAGIVLRCGPYLGGMSIWPLEISYVGGYEPLPADLEYAVLGAFDAVWAATPGWGGSVGGAAGEMQKISVVGVGSIDFGSSSASSSGAGGPQVGSQPWGVLPVTVTAVLQRYMNHTVIGGG